MAKIRLPANDWRPRAHQRKLWKYLEDGGKRAVAVWHRRAGKDDVALHRTAVAAFERVGTYWHLLPEAAQARKAIWEAVNPHTGKRRIDEAFPPKIRATTRDQEMFIRFVNGSTWQVVGSDNYNSLVGSPPIGIVFSEWALAKPEAWAYLRPILAENGGWALFIYTSRGNNHGKTTYDAAESDPAHWFAEKLRAADTDVFSKETLDRELDELIKQYGPHLGQALHGQEYGCSFDAPILGAYYGDRMTQAETEGRVCRVPWDPKAPVSTAWDLGAHKTAIWFHQRIGPEERLIDYIENSGVGLDWYAAEILKRPYAYREHFAPHDVEHRMLSPGAPTRRKTLEDLGIKPVRVGVPRNDEDRISAVRMLLPLCWFDAERCRAGIEALKQYRSDWDEQKKTFRPYPRKDWASDPADAFGELAFGLKPPAPPKKPKGERPAGSWMSS